MTRRSSILLLPLVLAFTPVLPAAGAAAPGCDLHVGEITLVVTDIYGQEELDSAGGVLRFVRGAMNTAHTGTRHHIIRRELLFRTGERLETEQLRETERNLRGLGYLTNVSVVPLDTLPDGAVPLEVRVQETWSLSTHTSYSRSSVGDRWSVSAADNNLLGYGVKLEMGLGEDEDRSFQRFTFANRRLLRSDFFLHASYADLSDGYLKSLTLARPFYSDDENWSLEAVAWDRSFKPRFYLSQGGPVGDGGEARLYASLPLREEGYSFTVTRRIGPVGRGRIWRLGAGLFARDRYYELPDLIGLSDGRSVSRELLIEDACPAICRETGRLMQPALVLESRGRRWTTERFVQCYGATEDLFLDPWLRLVSGPTLVGLGSDRERFLFEGSIRDWSRLGGGLLYAEAKALGSLGSPRNRFLSLDATVAWLMHPGPNEVSRLVIEAARGSDLEGTDAFVLGLKRGMRTVEYDGMAGDRLLRWNAEHAYILPRELLGFYRLGLAAFYAGGTAWWSDEARGLEGVRHEAGFGLRVGPTRSARTEPARLDLAWPLNDGGGGPKLTAITSGFF
ncbi:hypothetical protein H8E07_05260 [bacterium]|nr:hypothetical protein [bacterium]